jgi:hypothetical protein
VIEFVVADMKLNEPVFEGNPKIPKARMRNRRATIAAVAGEILNALGAEISSTIN